jgi:serine/threonine protein kinase
VEGRAPSQRPHLRDEGDVQGHVLLFRPSIITKRSIDSILNEREFLATLRHKFIVNMLYAFQDDDNLYILMNLMEGGDLRYHLSKLTVFSEGETKFMIASILMALDYLHSKLVVHRDVKPENIVFDRQGKQGRYSGYAYLTDLGIAKHLRANNS